ncbi:hypothetical protein C3B44_11505 [Corynebacterium yudongzhengii]|uniref:Secreted protein n=1 Tax=Corynebacterium yudongzhengii TaxID=2080740 RepID=A0A2U1T4K2_9CORY|nr:hypothetical protein [Corynebacterium yudongzhengii]AWB82875.1 hypothetical protein C3B44_11505 [Corynebacterium yudongzhengii]PWC00930.1 hypothetical protein DF222_10170 [Corynebacterium yudongzhengii]
MSRLRRLARRALVAGTAGVVSALSALSAPAVPALPPATPMSPDEDASREYWVSPATRPGEEDPMVELDLVNTNVTGADPARPGGEITLTLTVTNNSGETLESLTATPQRAEQVATVSEGRATLAAESTTYGYYGESTTLEPLSPGESREITLTVATDPEAESTLSITEDGLYPVLVSLQGIDPALGTTELITTERMLLPVGTPRPAEAQGMSMIMPVTAEVDIVPGETGSAPDTQPLRLASEQLAGELAPGGRLDELLDAHDTATHPQTLCLALDPELVDVVQRMSEGYTVSETRPGTSRPERLRDSWGSNANEDPGEPGTGSADAAAFIERLRAIAAQHCVISLPWAAADPNAVAGTNSQWLMRETVERGPAVLHRILGTPGMLNTVITPTGYVTPPAAPALRWADHESSQVAADGMAPAWERAVANPEAPPPERPNEVRVLVADNTIFGGATPGRFQPLTDTVTAVTYHDALAATLAATGEHPATVGYANPQSRYRLIDDSPRARNLTASGALQLASVDNSEQPVLAQLPLTLSPETARELIATADRLIDDGAARPLPVADYLTPTPEEEQRLNEAAPLSETGPEGFGSPFVDPGTYAETEILQARQQADYTGDLTRILANDPALALTRYAYTLPLRRDQIRALAVPGRNAASLFDDRVATTAHLLDGNGAMLQELRQSIVLLPPGNVFTRTSDNSPLLIVAENRLPLPVEAAIDYEVDVPGARLSTPEVIRIPAHGSITVEMTADLPAEADRSQVRMWLATDDGAHISAPVSVTVQTRGGTSTIIFAGLLLGIVAMVAVIRTIRARRRARGPDTG